MALSESELEAFSKLSKEQQDVVLKERLDKINSQYKSLNESTEALYTSSGVRADTKTLSDTVNDLGKEISNRNSQIQEIETENLIGDNVSESSLLSGTGTTTSGVVDNQGRALSDNFKKKANIIGSSVGSSPEDTIDSDWPGTTPSSNASFNQEFTDRYSPTPSSNTTGFGSNLEDTEVDVDEGNILPLIEDANNLGINPEFSPVSAIEKVGLNTQVSDPEDWRVRLHLPPDAEYLYNHPTYRGILEPLKETDGVIFPYTPNISVQHHASYSNYDLTHSNHRGYFYTGSSVQSITINTTFTAQDTEEANYMLAALHFFRSCTKMFYGQDVQRGMPPPVIMLTGFGEYQYKNHPCAITLMAYNLPDDTDYIAAGVPDGQNPYTGFESRLPTGGGYQAPTSRFSRMFGAGIGGLFGGESQTSQVTQPPPATTTGSLNDFGKLQEIYKGKTYVPTKVMVNLQLIPIQTRNQVSKEFSLREYANGELLKKGFW